MLSPSANSRALSWSIGPLIGTFSFRKRRNHLCTALLSSSCTSLVLLFLKQDRFYTFQIFYLCSSSMLIRYFLALRKGKQILMGSSFLQFFECLILYFVRFVLCSTFCSNGRHDREVSKRR